LSVERSLSQEDFVWLAGSLAQLHRLPFDPALIRQRFPPPHSLGQLLEALGALGFKSGEHAPGAQGLAGVRLPCVGFLKGEAPRPALLARAERGQQLYFTAYEQSAQIAPLGSIAERFEPELLLLSHETAAPVTEAEGGEAPGKFGFRWFAAELLRHKRVWRDVLAASLFIQLIGLATPLGTQVVIDKVIVNQTINTLIVVAAGLAMFLVFNSGMSWLRQYLVLHTGNRVDAVLGSQLFRHLLGLRLPYFEQRPTGTLVARVHAVETIREFLAGAAVSLLLDLRFLVVFIAVMFAYSWQLTLNRTAGFCSTGATSCSSPICRSMLAWTKSRSSTATD